MSSPQADPPYGFLRSCIDKRFVEATRREFEKHVRDDLNLPEFGPTSYWHEAYAGGSAKNPPGKPPDGYPDNTSDGEKYAADHGARIFGWQAHISNCGGFPPPPPPQDPEIEAGLLEMFNAKKSQYPQAIIQYMILARETETGEVKVHFTRYPPRPEEHST